MKKHLLTLKALILLLAACWSGNVSSQVVISQIYGGGGNSGATYTHDFVELFNRGQEPVNIGGWSIQYASAAGTGWASQITILPDFELQPGQYFLVQQAQGTGGTDPLPTPDFIPADPIAMSGTNLKLVLANSSVPVEGANPTNDNIVDLVGLGTANGYEGAVGPAISNTTAAFRKENGCQDTNNNAEDFITAVPAPRNSSSEFHVCPVVAVEAVVVTTEGGVPAVINTDNGTLQLVATVTPADANQNVVWSIEAGEEFATISESGLLTAVDNGVVTVRATSVSDEAIYGEIEVTITNQEEDIEVVITVENGGAAEITTNGGTLQLIATVTPATASQEVEWTVTSGVEFAIVDENGLVTALANGTAVVRATSLVDEDIYDEIEIVITGQVVEVESITVTTQGGASTTLTTEGATVQLVATVLPAEADQNVVWSVQSGTDVVTVSNAGLVTAVANGTAVVRATSASNDTVFGEITITVDIINSVNEVEGAALVVYPNPTSGLVFLADATTADITVYNAQGQLILSANNQRTIDLSGFENGIYTVRIEANGHNVVKRIVKF